MKRDPKKITFYVVIALMVFWSIFWVGYNAMVFAGTRTITFAWEQDISEGFAGWKLYMSTSPNVQVVTTNLFATIPYNGTPSSEYTTEKSLTSPDGQEVTYYFVMTAFDNSGNESDKSNEVFAVIDFVKPSAPNTLKVIVVGQ